jgi:outer membrane immunogenic protein
MMKPLTVIVAFAVLSGTPAFAADIAVKASPVAPAPVFSWTGFYGGLNMGVSFGDASTNWNYFAPSGTAPLGGPPTVCGISGGAFCISDSDTVNMNGPIGGAQVGYNWQTGNFLAGIEADFQGTGQSGTRDLTIPFQVNGISGGTAGVSITERMLWLGTVRGRLGYVADRSLLYATGGLAYGRVEVDSSTSATGFFAPDVPGAPPPCPAGGPCPVWNFSGNGVTKTGWTIGGGAEWAVGGNWSAKVEYLFVDLGSFNTTFTGFAGCFGTSNTCHAQAAGVGNISSKITDNIVRVGLNYQFH